MPGTLPRPQARTTVTTAARQQLATSSCLRLFLHDTADQLLLPLTPLLPAPLYPARLTTPKSNTHVVLATLKRAQNDMSSYQRKMFKVDDHMGIAIAGLTADGRVLCKYLRNECINHR